MNKTITLRDIANALNLSVSTVSRALTDSYQIGDETKQRVLAYANAHHYLPNRLARGLKEGKSRTIGVVVCSIDNNFVAQMLDGIDHYCTEQGYQLIIMQSKESFEQEKACVALLYASGIDGLLISPSYQTTDFEYLIQLQQSGLPIVLFDRLSDQMNTHKVAVANFKAAYDATLHLIEQGHQSIAHINSFTQLRMATERFEGYKAALKDSGLTFRQELVKFCTTTSPETLQENLNTALQELMALEKRPSAIFTATDQLSTRCLAMLHQLNYKVPEELALIGFSNTDLADALNPALSTIRQPSFEIGRLATVQLLSLIKHKHEDFETILLPVQIDVRASSTFTK